MRFWASPLTNRAGLVALGLALLFLALQTVEFTIHAAPAPARLLTLAGNAPAAPANGDTTFITAWGQTISAPGIYALGQNISGTNNVGIFVASNSVTLVGNGFGIFGDGTIEGTDNETGVALAPGASHSHLQVVGIQFGDLDNGVFFQNAPTAANSVILFSNNAFVGNQFSIYLLNPGDLSKLTLSDNTFSNGFTAIRLDNPGSADSLLFEGNTFSNVSLPHFLTNSGDAADLIFVGNDNFALQFQNPGTVSGVTITENSLDVLSSGLAFQNSGTATSTNVTVNVGLVFFLTNFDTLSQVLVSGNQFREGAPGLLVTNNDTLAGLDVTANDELVLNVFNNGNLSDLNIAGNNFETASLGFNVRTTDQLNGLTFTDNSVHAPAQVLHFGGELSGVEFINNYFENNVNYALTFWISPTVTSPTVDLLFEGNTVDAASGIFIVDGPPQDSIATLSRASLRDNAFSGGFEPVSFPNPVGYITLIGGGDSVSIINNTMTGGSVPGISLRSWFTPEASIDHPFTNIFVESNVIQNLSGQDAIVLEKYYGDSAGLDLPLAPNFALALPNSPGVLSIRANSLVANGGVGVRLTPPEAGPFSIDARWNWWGDPLGPNGPDGDGVGSGVTFDPWLSEAPNGGEQTQTSTASATVTRTATPTASRTATPTASRTATPTASRTATPTASRTATPTGSTTTTSTPTGTGSRTPTTTVTRTPTTTATRTPTATHTTGPQSVPEKIHLPLVSNVGPALHRRRANR